MLLTRGEKLIEHEYIVLTKRDGRLACEAHPAGQATATLMSQPITGPGQLLTWLEATAGGKTRRIEFNDRIVNCVAP